MKSNGLKRIIIGKYLNSIIIIYYYNSANFRKEAEIHLIQKSIGVFLIRKSESKLNNYALSIKVPKYINQTEISHYLIEKTNKFYKFHGSDKKFTNLTALVTHCSLVRDLLPIVLNLRYYQQQNQIVENFYYSPFVQLEVFMQFNDQISN